MWTEADIASRVGASGTEGNCCCEGCGYPSRIIALKSFLNSCDRNDCNCNQDCYFKSRLLLCSDFYGCVTCL